MGELDFNYGFNLPGLKNVTPTYDCVGSVICKSCGKDHGTCADLERSGRSIYTNHGQSVEEWEKQQMVDLGSHYDNDARKGGGKFKRRPFLKAKDIAAKGSQAKILDFREAPKSMEYSDFLCDVSIGKKEFTWGLKSKTVTLNMLIEELGKRTEKWIGKSVKLVRAGNKGQYVNVGS